jgi:hypothetical protein
MSSLRSFASFISRLSTKKRVLILVIALLGLIGSYFTFRLTTTLLSFETKRGAIGRSVAISNAIASSLEAEDGMITAPATVVVDASASANKAMKFGAPIVPPSGTGYNAAVLADRPVGFWALNTLNGTEADLSAHGHTATYKGGATAAKLPNNDTAAAFNGTSQYVEIPDNDAFSVPTTGTITIEAWMRPDVLDFPASEAEGYVHWMGKGVPGQHEYVSRMYNHATGRPNRISGYSYNLSGGLGTGSYFQDTVTAGQWIYYVLIITTAERDGQFPTGSTKVYKNGVQRDKDALTEYNITPGNGMAPFRIGTRDLNSYLKGAVGKVAIYDYALSQAQISAHYTSMTGKQP